LLDDSIYALKKVKLHIGTNETLQDHKVYREIYSITKLEPRNILRYYTCWIEALEHDELNREKKLVEKFKNKLNAKNLK
jgi:eukaryotic translation initiation factor 2-alpha kinase 1